MAEPTIAPDQTTLRWSWSRLTWDDAQRLGGALAALYPRENLFKLGPERARDLAATLPGFQDDGTIPDDFLLGSIISAWIQAEEGPDDSSPYEYLG